MTDGIDYLAGDEAPSEAFDWWPLRLTLDERGKPFRYVVMVDGMDYGFSDRGIAAGFVARCGALAFTRAEFIDRGRP